MSLSNIERQVLELVCREGKKCRGGVATPTITRSVEPYSACATVGALHALKSDGLLSVTGADASSRGWMPTTKGEAVLRSADSANVLVSAKDQEAKASHAEVGKRAAEELIRFLSGNDRISADLLNRCATMNATLLAQAEQAHAAGDTDAWRDLAWLMETGRQLVAIGGEV